VATVQHYTGSQNYTFTYPVGWHLIQSEYPINNAFFRTEVINPGGTESVIVDRTPNEPLSPAKKSVQVQQYTEHTSTGYVPIASHSITVSGQDGFIWEFQLPGAPGPGPYKVDLFLHRGTSGYAVLGSGANLKAVEAITMSVAQSLTTR
jgi:hypothetical protein